MKLRNFLIMSVAAISIALCSCRKEEAESDPRIRMNRDIMLWMYSVMDQVYFWNYKLPPYSLVRDESDPAEFFDRLLYKPGDRWSWLTDDYQALQLELQGKPVSMGIGPYPGRYPGSDKVFIVVSYVYPGSPADRAGLKRGDIITKINGQQLDTLNYYDLFSLENYSLSLGYFNDTTIITTDTGMFLSAEVIDADPVLFDSVFVYNNHLVGYITYLEFISGDEDKFLESFASVIDDFSARGITDLVMDLRYNPGGEVETAAYIASCLVPPVNATAGDVFANFRYNEEVQTYFEKSEGADSPSLVHHFFDTNHNLNLGRVFFLTGARSASASELLIISLEPYMDIITVGEDTYGKYTGAWVIPDTRDPPKHNWAVVPIVSKYSNASGFTDFINGLPPDFPADDDMLRAKPFGDVTDPVLGRAIEIITGEQVISKKMYSVSGDIVPVKYLKEPGINNLYLPVPEKFGIR